ncbi:MAG: Ni,Fe-hydrogenase I large subunit [Desulfobulbaceae bacterium]|nr:MAG: Ni,Fe-hydrogenase I large subunit [Desulfobulbaceae bacterium]
MKEKATQINLPLNRAEGDLEVLLEVKDGRLEDAWSSGTMFRGFEDMMKGRGALDGLVVTPRICGICSLTHLTAAVEALDKLSGVRPPDNAYRLRNIALMVETVQSDVRHSILMFMVDMVNEMAYQHFNMFAEAKFRYSPMQGAMANEVIRETKRLLKIIAIIGGQWPHTSFMVPGGVTSIPDQTKILQCTMIIKKFISWYEKNILGCSLARWGEVANNDDLDNWLEESIEHRESEVGFMLRFLRMAGLDLIGSGPNRYLCFGNFPLPDKTDVTGINGKLLAAGYAEGTAVDEFSDDLISEDVSHSWYEQQDEPLHPFEGGTVPSAVSNENGRYSWVKAPRYDGKVVETGPLAEMIVNRNPLFVDLVERQGSSVLSRQLARLVRPALLLPNLMKWLEEVAQDPEAPFYEKVGAIPDGQSAGLVQAARGALGHWIKVVDERITHYQVITPTAWNGSPRDRQKNRGAWEEALIGTEIKNEENPIEAGHIVRSFDPCLVCAVHTVKK